METKPWESQPVSHEMLRVCPFAAVALKSHMKPITPRGPLKAIKQHRNSSNLCLIMNALFLGFSIAATGSFAHMQKGADGEKGRLEPGRDQSRLKQWKTHCNNVWVCLKEDKDVGATSTRGHCLVCEVSPAWRSPISDSNLWPCTALAHLLKSSTFSAYFSVQDLQASGHTTHKLLSDMVMWNNGSLGKVMGLWYLYHTSTTF